MNDDGMSGLNETMNDLNANITDSLSASMASINEYQFRKHNPVEDVYDNILEQIEKFESELDNEHEIGGTIVNSGIGPFYITAIKKLHPSQIVFYGEGENGPIQIIIHINQLNIILVSLKKKNKNESPRRLIGFTLD